MVMEALLVDCSETFAQVEERVFIFIFILFSGELVAEFLEMFLIRFPMQCSSRNLLPL